MPVSQARIYLRVVPAYLGVDVLAMLDTGAPWCIFEPSVGKAIVKRLEELPGELTLDTRLGRFTGNLYLGNVTLLAEHGDDLDIESTIFLSPEWPGGNFVGYLGFLDRINSALRPQENKFFFGPPG